jgi:hypothetical protein
MDYTSFVVGFTRDLAFAPADPAQRGGAHG